METGWISFGAGMGALPNLHGLSGDGMKDFEVLIDDGSLINANSKESSDFHCA
ncbi:uncharacterized protein BO96DRAFT_413858 [Aspergillus niger CBS 101883]|uniref:uncharacterized protein n=1 Tax=Aspergillus lacticoffeatus (strain CBS 101883) TaxID=1450533 RepID=UPI000D7F3621|nr:uncharacterized protein BO96DRAFT_413858 [Aspergillus niger CBS 101883]PYH54379.1 hypothetical protein BO96DRAFT_413858 [Aspergillus niger CBS 101883]